MDCIFVHVTYVIASVCYKVKPVGKSDAVVVHVRFDVAGAGNVAMVEM